MHLDPSLSTSITAASCPPVLHVVWSMDLSPFRLDPSLSRSRASAGFLEIRIAVQGIGGHGLYSVHARIVALGKYALWIGRVISAMACYRLVVGVHGWYYVRCERVDELHYTACRRSIIVGVVTILVMRRSVKNVRDVSDRAC